MRAYAAEVRPVRPTIGAGSPTAAPAPEQTPPVRIEEPEHRNVVPMAELRAGLRADVARVLEENPRVVVVTPDPGVGKTQVAVDMLAGRFDKLHWVVDTHENANGTVDRLKAAGHTDVAAIPPRDATTCQCWTAEDAARLRDENPGFRNVLPMVDAKIGRAHV